jgi:hypothetical protein
MDLMEEPRGDSSNSSRRCQELKFVSPLKLRPISFIVGENLESPNRGSIRMRE